VWAAVGVHGGLHVATTLTWTWLAPVPSRYWAYLLVLAVSFTLVALGVLRRAARAGRLSWRGQVTE
jgi:hypothetical protein